jgi:hypothetical protein
MVATNFITQPINALAKFNVIAKIYKYRRFHERHHFIPMAMEVHNTPRHDMDCFIKELVVFFTIDNQNVIYPCLFAFNFSSNM